MSDTQLRAPLGPEQPRSRSELFWAFTLLALQGFGGVLAVAQRVLVEERRWFTQQQFLENWAAAQILPGPNIMNLSMMIGDRYFGFTGALAAILGMLSFPLCIVLLLTISITTWIEPTLLNNMLRGMGVASAGLLLGTALRLSSALKTNAMGRWACIIVGVSTFVLVAIVRVKLAWVLLGLGGLTCLYAAWLLHKRGAAK